MNEMVTCPFCTLLRYSRNINKKNCYRQKTPIVTESDCQSSNKAAKLTEHEKSTSQSSDCTKISHQRRFPEAVRNKLETSFLSYGQGPHIPDIEIDQLMNSTGLSKAQISKWFANKRSRTKRQTNHRKTRYHQSSTMLIDRTNKPQQRLSHCPVITPMYESRPEISFPIALPTMHNYQSLGDQPMFPPLLPPSFFQGQHCPPGSSSSMLIANLANPQHQQTAFMLNRILMQNFFISSANKPGNC